jgi:hypothetical protein
MESAAIERVKNVLVSSLDHNLPKVSLEFFLQYETEGAPISWKVTDCGEPSRSRAAERGRAPATCVQADVDLKDNRALTLLISVGSKTVPSEVPALRSVTITDEDGSVRTVRHLSKLPMELHRPRPVPKRDLPLPWGNIAGNFQPRDIGQLPRFTKSPPPLRMISSPSAHDLAVRRTLRLCPGEQGQEHSCKLPVNSFAC